MKELLVLGVLALLGFVGAIIASYYDPSFLRDFLPNFFSDFFVGILIAGLVSWLLSRSKRVGVKMSVDTTYVGESIFLLIFSVENTGRVSFNSREIYWHVFIDGKLDMIGDVSRALTRPAEDGYSTYSEDLITRPLFPGRRTNVLSVKVRAPRSGKYNIFYYLSTAHGLFPKGIKEAANGGFLFDTLAKMPISLSEKPLGM